MFACSVAISSRRAWQQHEFGPGASNRITQQLQQDTVIAGPKLMCDDEIADRTLDASAVFRCPCCSAQAFAPASFTGAKLAPVRAVTVANTQMSSLQDMPGVSAPLGAWDPLGFSKASRHTAPGREVLLNDLVGCTY